MRTIFGVGLLLAVASGALADQAGADACAAGLPTDASTIYSTAAPGFAAAADKRAFVTAKVKALVIAGTVKRSSARTSALTAGVCLKKLL